jgi:hypothetical protein
VAAGVGRAGARRRRRALEDRPDRRERGRFRGDPVPPLPRARRRRPERPGAFLPPRGGSSATWADLLGSVFGLEEAWGAVQLRSASPALVVTSQTFTPGGGGTYGQSVPLFAEAELLRSGATRTIPAIREDASFRTNLVLANGGEAACDVDVSLLSEGGALLGTRRVPLAPLGMTQLTRVVRALGVDGAVSGARLVLSTPTAGGAFAAYASVIDEKTSDPRTLLPR